VLVARKRFHTSGRCFHRGLEVHRTRTRLETARRGSTAGYSHAGRPYLCLMRFAYEGTRPLRPQRSCTPPGRDHRPRALHCLRAPGGKNWRVAILATAVSSSRMTTLPLPIWLLGMYSPRRRLSSPTLANPASKATLR
ncbi:unnamed protein product, partial [Ectocarpus sp. 6 AP-2014]